mgnify:CR=1 FL=1
MIVSGQIIGSVVAGKVTTMVSNDSSFGYVQGGTYTIAGRPNEFVMIGGDTETASIKFIGDEGDWYVLVTANLSVRASVSGTTAVEATLGFSAEEGDLTDWSQRAEQSGGTIHLSVQFNAQMNTTSRSTIHLFTKGTSYDSTLDVLRVQISAVLLGAVNP